MIYEKPPMYTISHIAIGFIANWFPPLMFLGLAYQLLQLGLNLRFFPIEGIIVNGNHFIHTTMKIAEMGLGFLFAYFISTFYTG